MTGPLPSDLREALSDPQSRERLGSWVGQLRYAPIVTSTNDLAMAWARDGAPDGATLIASEQSAGRGRRGREWFSPPEAGVYVSVVLRRCEAPMLTLLAGVAVAEAIRALTQLPAELEWPNDLMLSAGRDESRRPRTKVGGILCETCTEGGAGPAVVVGIGINLASVSYPMEIAHRAASLEDYVGYRVDRGALVVECLAGLASWRERYVGEGTAPILERWRALSPSSKGELVRWTTGEGPRTGRTAGIDDDGALRVDVEGRTERIVAGTLEWLSR